MRFAAIADVHDNRFALETVLADITAIGRKVALRRLRVALPYSQSRRRQGAGMAGARHPIKGIMG